jgi:putative superfamily III holin-X
MDTTARFTTPPENRSLISLVADLFRETSTLVHQEAELAKAELSEKVSEVGKGIAAIAIGGAILFAGFIVLLLAACNGLAMMLPEQHAGWLAPLIVGLAVMVLGFIAVGIGKHELSGSNLKPSRTMESLRQDSQLVKEHLT